MTRSGFLRLRVVVGAAAARLYLLAILYVFFLNTDLRTDRNDFLYQRAGQSRENRESEIRTHFWERLAPYDGQFYLDIANHGYRTISYSIHGELGNYAFFPLLPAILATIRAALPGVYIPLTIALTFLAGVLGTLTLWKLAERCGVSPLLSLGSLLCFPSAPFQFVLYNEGVALCLSGLALVYTMERKPWLTALFGLLAGLSRPQGILLAIPAFVELLLPTLKEGGRGSRAKVGACVSVCAPFVGFVVMGIVSHSVCGSATSFLTVQSKWGRTYEAGGIFRALLSVFGYVGPPMDLLGLLLGLGVLPLMWKRLPVSLFFYGVGAVLMPLLTGSILSLARFMSVSLPHLLALALFLQGRGPGTRLVLFATFLVLQTLLARGLIGWYFVG